MPAAILTVDYERVPGYPRESLSAESIEVIDMLQCAYVDRITLTKELLGYAVGSILYSPHKYDFGTDPIANIYCSAVNASGLKDGYSNGDYTWAHLEVLYRSREYEEPPTGVVYYTESIEPASEFITLGYEKLYWSDNDEIDMGEAPTKVLRMVDWVYSTHQMSFIPNWVWTHPGTINNTVMISRTFNKAFAIGTLLCANPTLNREFTMEGVTAWTITVRLSYRKEGWNKFPRSDKTTNNVVDFQSIYSATGGGAGDIINPYPSSDFSEIVI